MRRLVHFLTELLVCGGSIGRSQSIRLTLLAVFVVASAHCGPDRPNHARSTAEWQQLLQATGSNQRAKSEATTKLLRRSLEVGSRMWPVDTFLQAELHRLRGENEEARIQYRSLVEWGAADPYKDGWGGSGLTAIAFWRWLQFAIGGIAKLDQEEISRMLECDQKLRSTRLVRGMYSAPLLETLPQIEEESVRGLAQLAWIAGRTDAADRLFLDYLQLARTDERNATENQIWEHLIKSRQATDDHLKLLLAKRLNTLGMNDSAALLLRSIRHSNDADVRAEAEYLLARLEIVAGVRRDLVLNNLTAALDDAADPRLFQQILLQRGLTYNRPGQGHDGDRFVEDLEKLVSEFPDGSLVNRALYELGRHFQEANDATKALAYFETLQNNDNSKNDRFELSYYQAVFTLYTRRGPGDLVRAKDLLQELLKKRPYGDLRSLALFWLGRLAEDRGDEAAASSYFRQVVNDAPYDFYAIRARMHMNLGPQARFRLWPDQTTNLDLSYRHPSAAESFSTTSDYAGRLREALDSQLYSMSLEADEQLRHDYPSRRLENITTNELDADGTFSRISLLIALREDAQAATDVRPRERLLIAGAVGKQSRDWPQAISLCYARSEAENREEEVQHNAGFTAVAYPLPFSKDLRNSAAKYKLPAELLYGVARRESYFYPAALSFSGALGLFQFTPPTFEDLDKKWKLLQESGVGTREEFLLSPERSIDLGARAFSRELIPRNKGNIVAVLVEHNAGRKPAQEWSAKLRSQNQILDLEYAIERIPYMETRRFARGVLADASVIRAIGALGSQ